jgi:metal-sulfur cluster biosynthetic enzyme
MVNTDYEVKILMTLTSPNCPVAESLPREVEDKVKSIKSVKAEVEITFDPPWSKDLMSEEEAKLELGML